jgi:heme/copper-type cytochrome/quinol oxidase subunit 2
MAWVLGLKTPELLILLVMMPLMLIPVIAVIDIVSSEFKGYDKIMWIMIVLFLPVAGALIYFAIGRKQKLKPGELPDDNGLNA